MAHILYKIPLVPYTELLRGVDAAIILGVTEISATEDVDFLDVGRVTGVIDLSGSGDRLAAFLDFDVVTANAVISSGESYLLTDTDTIISIAEFDASASIDAVDQDMVMSIGSATADDALNGEFIDTTVVVTASINTSNEEFSGVDSASETATASISSVDTHSAVPEASTASAATFVSAVEFAAFRDSLAQVFGVSSLSVAESAAWLDSAALVSTGQISGVDGRTYQLESTTVSGVSSPATAPTEPSQAQLPGIGVFADPIATDLLNAVDVTTTSGSNVISANEIYSPPHFIPSASASASSPAPNVALGIPASVATSSASAPTPDVTYAYLDSFTLVSRSAPATAPTEPSLAQLPQLDLVVSDVGTDLSEPIDVATVSGASVVATSLELYNIHRSVGPLPATAVASSPAPSVAYAFLDGLTFTTQGQPATAPTTTTLAQITKVGLETTGPAVDLFD